MGKPNYAKFPDDIEIDEHKIAMYARQIEAVDRDIKKCETRIKDLTQRKITIGHQYLEQPLLWDLFYNKNVNSKEICHKFGIKSLYDLKQIIGTCDIVYHCAGCQTELRITVKSKEQMKKGA